MSRRAISVVMVLLTALQLSATTIKELWIAAPDTLFPYLDQAKRSELVDFWEMKQKGQSPETNGVGGLKVETKNKLDGVSTLDTLTSNFMQVGLNKSTRVQMKLVEENGDTLICMVKTISLPEGDSEVAFYDKGWNLKRSAILNWHNYLKKPEAMSEEIFKNEVQAIRLAFVKASINADDNWMDVTLGIPLQPKEMKPELKAIMQTNVKIDISSVK